MHIRNLSDNKMANFDKAVNDSDVDKGVQSLISEFWVAENSEMITKTWLGLAEIEIDKYHLNNKDGIWFITFKSSQHALIKIDEEFEDIDEVKNYIYEDLTSIIDITNFIPDFKDKTDSWIDEKLI